MRELRASGLSATAFAAERGISATRLSYWAERLGLRASDDVDFVAVAVPQGVEFTIEHQGVVVSATGVDVDAVAQLVVGIVRRARTC